MTLTLAITQETSYWGSRGNENQEKNLSGHLRIYKEKGGKSHITFNLGRQVSER